MNQPLESPESSTPIITRAVAAGLLGQYADTYNLPGWQARALRGLARLPQGVARAVISRFESLSGLNPALLEGISIDMLIQERLRDYEALPGRFPAVTIGAGLGGASAHLALAVGGPFLPQAFVTTLRGGSPNGDVSRYFERSAELARRIAASNPSILTIQHFDPVHDGWMTRYVNHLRFKLLDLPWAYRDFLRRRLEPGGVVVYLECRASWLRFRTGVRSVFQVGGWGGLTASEFLESSPRLNEYCRSAGLRKCDWRLPGYPLEEGPESEWGCEAGLGEALETFCHREGFIFVPISLPEPHDYSRLAFRAVQRILAKEGRAPSGVLVEMFSQFDATVVMQAGLLPLWLVFNTLDSLDFLNKMRPLFPQGLPVFFSPLATFSLTPDLVPWGDWEAALQGLTWHNIGARPDYYPADPLALVNWAAPLRSWAAEQSAASGGPLRARLEGRELAMVQTRDLGGSLG